MKFLSPINVNTEYTLPFVDGTNGQVLTTDGNGAVYWGSVSAGVTNLNALTDVELTSPTSGQILRYELPPGGQIPIWRNVTPNYLTPNSSINALVDVTISSPAVGQLLRWNGTYWLNWTPDFLTAHPAITNGGSVNNSNGTVIQDITLETNGHVTAITSLDLDTRYYTESEITGFFGGEAPMAGYNQTNWDTAYSWGNHASAGYLTSFTETDPTVPAHVKSITATNISNWNDAFNDSIRSASFNTTNGVLTLTQVDLGTVTVDLDGRYLQTFTETDPTVPAYVKAITETQIGDWDRAYNWGNHADAGYAPVASPSFTGTPLAPTAAAGTNTTQIATTAFVQTAVSNLVDAAPSTLDTLNELAAALGDDPNFATTVTNSIATKVPQTRTLTINGTAFDLSANRSWTIDSADGYVSDVRLVESTLSFSGEGSAFTGNIDLSTLPFQPAGSYLTAEADTLATVTSRGATTTNEITTSTHTISNGHLILSGASSSVNPEIEFTDDSGFGVAGYKLRYENANGWTFYDSYWASGGGHRFRTGIASSTIEALTITHTGNVGIGTTSPTSKLQVSGNIDATGVISQTFWTNDSIRKLNAGAPLNFRTAAGPIEMILDGSGNLGIGADNPQHGLHVIKNQNQVAAFQSPNPNTWIDLISTAGTWSMGATASNTWAIYQRGAVNATEFEVTSSAAFISGEKVATQTWVQSQGYLTSETDSQTLDWDAPNKNLSITNGNTVTLDGLATEEFVTGQGYITGEADTLASVTGRGASTTSSITVNGSLLIGPSGTANAYDGAATGKLYFGNQVSDSPTHYHITTNMENYNGNYSKLDIRWYTGQRFYAHIGYGGFRFHEITTAAELFSVGKGDAHVRVANNLYVSGGTTSGDITVSGSSAGIYFTGGNNRIYFAGARAIEGNGTNLQIGEGHSQTQIQSSTTRVDGILTTAGTSINTSNGARIFGLKSESGKYFTQNAFGQDGGYTWPSTTYVTSNDNSPVGNVTFRGNGTYQGHIGPEFIPIDATKTYKVSVWIRAVSGSPFCYLSHRQYYWDYSNGNPGNGGWGNPYWWSGTPSSSWTEYSMTIGPAGSGADHTHMAGVKFIRHGWLHNYTSDGSATAEFQGWRIEELDSTLANNVTVMGNAVVHAGNIGSQSVSYAATSGNSVTTSQTNFSELFIEDAPVATKEYVTSQGYITGYTETDTLATVTGRGASTSSPITINGGGSQPLSLTTSSGSPWHLALVRTDLGLTSRVFAHNSPYNCWYFEHNISIAGNTNWHSGNDGSGSGLDADLLDGVNGASFLRNDVVGAGVSGTIISTNNANVDGSNFTVDTVNKTVNEYAYKVSRSGSAVGGILIDGRGVFPSVNVNGASVTSTTISNWNSAYSWGNHASAGYFKLEGTDPITIQAETVTFTGNVTIEGTLTESSSIRFKESIEPLQPSLEAVNALNPVSYNKIGEDNREIGLIAEDVAELFPEVVTYNEDGQPQGIQYQRLSVILLKAVQELTERVNKLENK